MAGRRHCSVRTTGATAGRIRHDGKGALRQLKLLARLRAAHGLAFLDDDWMLSALARRPAAASPLVRSPPDRATPAATAANVAVPEEAEAEAEQRVAGLSLDLGSFYMPKKGESPRGEDAHFVSEALGAFGVADGVGSWSNRGIDAGEFARQLMSFCEADLGTGCSRRGNASPGTALEGLLERALARTTARGTSTACVAVVDGRILRAVNVGDSGFLVVRGGKIVYRSPFQQRGFNQPFQVGGVDRSYPPEYASRLCVEIEPGDIIVAGTDGLFDNLFDEETLDVLARAEADGHGAPEEMAHALGCAAVQAYEAGVGRETPFSMACREAKFFWRGGGKDDDVTVVIARVREKRSHCHYHWGFGQRLEQEQISNGHGLEEAMRTLLECVSEGVTTRGMFTVSGDPAGVSQRVTATHVHGTLGGMEQNIIVIAIGDLGRLMNRNKYPVTMVLKKKPMSFCEAELEVASLCSATGTLLEGVCP